MFFEYCNSIIKIVYEFKFMGLYINAKLNCPSHINVVVIKISRAVGPLRRPQPVFLGYILLLFILTYVTSCYITNYHGVVKQTHFFLLQKKLYEQFFSSGYNSYTEPLFNFVNIMK